jgi:hypothetical protein
LLLARQSSVNADGIRTALGAGTARWCVCRDRKGWLSLRLQALLAAVVAYWTQR